MDYDQQVEDIVSKATYGDLVEFSYPIGYSHWAVYEEDGHVIHFAVADESQLMNSARKYLEQLLPVCGDLLLGQTKIRRVPLAEVNVPKGAHVMISNNRHAFAASTPQEMRRRCDALVDQTFNYDLFTLNCEHFATFVRYGAAVCNQIPGNEKNVENEDATNVFNETVLNKRITDDLFN